MWDLAKSQLRVRLRLAMLKTTTVYQRSIIVGAIIIPKLLYIGRHAWPSAKMVHSLQKMIKNYVWHGHFTDETLARRAWLNREVASLPRGLGGIALPNLMVDLHALAAVTVHSWAEGDGLTARVVGKVLLTQAGVSQRGHICISPHMNTFRSTAPRHHGSLWGTGLAICQHACDSARHP